MYVCAVLLLPMIILRSVQPVDCTNSQYVTHTTTDAVYSNIGLYGNAYKMAIKWSIRMFIRSTKKINGPLVQTRGFVDVLRQFHDFLFF